MRVAVSVPAVVSDVAISKPTDVSSRVATRTISALERADLTETGSGAVSGGVGEHPTVAIRTQAARIRFSTFDSLLG